MVAKVITIGNQKGGVGKTTTAACIAYFLAKEHKVLAIDMDMQANLTQVLTKQNIAEFSGKSMLQALIKGNLSPYILDSVDKNAPGLSVAPAFDDLAFFKFQNEQDQKRLDYMINQVKNEYDFVIIDTPPSLGDHLVSGMLASDYVCCLSQTHSMSVDATHRFLARFMEIRKLKPDLKLLGIIISIFRKIKKNFVIEDLFREHYKDYVFATKIFRETLLEDLTATGISERTADHRRALEQYKKLTEELRNRVQ